MLSEQRVGITTSVHWKTSLSVTCKVTSSQSSQDCTLTFVLSVSMVSWPWEDGPKGGCSQLCAQP